MTKNAVIVLALLGMVIVSTGCPSRQQSLCTKIDTTPKKQGNLAEVEQLAEAAYKQRGDVKELRKAITHWKEAVAIAPTKTKNYVKLSRALYLLGDGYLRLAEEDDAMIAALEEATNLAESALSIQNKNFRNAVCEGADVEEVVDQLNAEDVPAVYWYATALGKWGLANNILVALKNKDKIFAMMQRVRELNPDYWFGAVDRYLGAFYTKIPFPSGDEEKSLEHFQASLKRAPNYLATSVLMAKMLAPKLDDEEGRRMYKERLEFVINAADDIIPELVPEHRLEKMKAKTLLEEIDDRF